MEKSRHSIKAYHLMPASELEKVLHLQLPLLRNAHAKVRKKFTSKIGLFGLHRALSSMMPSNSDSSSEALVSQSGIGKSGIRGLASNSLIPEARDIGSPG